MSATGGVAPTRQHGLNVRRESAVMLNRTVPFRSVFSTATPRRIALLRLCGGVARVLPCAHWAWSCVHAQRCHCREPRRVHDLRDLHDHARASASTRSSEVSACDLGVGAVR